MFVWWRTDCKTDCKQPIGCSHHQFAGRASPGATDSVLRSGVGPLPSGPRAVPPGRRGHLALHPSHLRLRRTRQDWPPPDCWRPWQRRGNVSDCENEWSLCVDEWSLCVDEWSLCVDEWSLCVDEWSLCVDEWSLCVDEWSLCVDEWTFCVDCFVTA